MADATRKVLGLPGHVISGSHFAILCPPVDKEICIESSAVPASGYIFNGDLMYFTTQRYDEAQALECITTLALRFCCCCGCVDYSSPTGEDACQAPDLEVTRTIKMSNKIKHLSFARLRGKKEEKPKGEVLYKYQGRCVREDSSTHKRGVQRFSLTIEKSLREICSAFNKDAE